MKLSEIFKQKLEKEGNYISGSEYSDGFVDGASYFADEITPKVAFRFLQYCDNVFYYDTRNERFIDPGSDEVYTFEQVWEHFLNNIKFE